MAALPISVNSYASVSGSGSSLSMSFTVNAGDERGLYVCIPGYGTTVTSVTYNGVGVSNLTSGGNSFQPIAWYGLLMPPVGTYTLTVNFAFSITGAGMNAVCLNNVDQTDINLSPPTIVSASTGTSSNDVSFCGDLPNRNMYALAAVYGNGGVGFTYNTSFDSFADFASRTALVPAFTDYAFSGSANFGIAGYGRRLANGTYKFTINHSWSGPPPNNSTPYIFINETLTEPSAGTVGQAIFI